MLIGAIVGIVLAVVLTGSDDDVDVERKFAIDYEHDTFLMNGKPFKYVAGSFHYFRALPQTWREKIKTMKAGGVNAVDIYVHWALHNPKDWVYDWDGIADIEKIIEIATEEGLYIILRPGPYICAELDNGGLPFWLARKYPNIKVRTSDPDYLREVERWYSHLMPRLMKHFYGNGGNIILVQIENEYGAYGVCDEEYKLFLRNQTLEYTQGNAVLFTTDRPYDRELECGSVEDVFITTDFGLSDKETVEKHFKRLREVQPKGPLVNTEFYSGWFTRWGEPNARRNGAELLKTLEYMFEMNANVDFYMYFGGTSFGFWAGANDAGIGGYMSDITSYDYDAPMDETGSPTEKYNLFKGPIIRYLGIDEKELPIIEKKAFGSLSPIEVSAVGTILSAEGREYLGARSIKSERLLTFEELDQFSGFVLYETTLPKLTRDPSNLVISGLRDRALIYIDDEFVGALSRENLISTFPISAGFGTKLSILVENQGRINFDILDDYKGIVQDVKIQIFDNSPYEPPQTPPDTYLTLRDWEITGFPFEKPVELEHYIRVVKGNSSDVYELSRDGNCHDGPVVFHGEFVIEDGEQIKDTWWNTEGWGKGFFYVNGWNLGRYWPLYAPQVTMYIPKELLRTGRNIIYIVELQKFPNDRRILTVDKPHFSKEEQL